MIAPTLGRSGTRKNRSSAVVPGLDLRIRLADTVTGRGIEHRFTSHVVVELAADGTVRHLELHHVPDVVRDHSRPSGPGHDVEGAVVLGQPLLDLDARRLWIPLADRPGVSRVTGQALVVVRHDERVLLDLRLSTSAHALRSGELT